MNPICEVLLATTLLSASDTTAAVQPRPIDSDRWIAEDKFKHAAMSFAATSFLQAGLRSTGMETGTAVPAAAAVAGIVGIGKEVHDRRNGGSFSIRDLAWDALGIMPA